MRTLMCRPMMLAGLFLAGAAFLGWGGIGVQADDKKDAGSKDQRPNTLTEQEKAAGWKLLFDGKTTDGWRAYRGKKMPDKWHVLDGALVFTPGSGNQGGDIVTTDQYDSFDLAFEWKISSGGNSGVMYRVSEEEESPYMTGPEYQILDN